MYRKIVTLYEFFYRKFYKQEFYKFSPSESAHKQIESFIDLLDKKYHIESVGNNLITTYFIFQFDYWSKLDITAYNKQINLSYIIGPKAFKRWLDRDRDFDWTIESVEIGKLTITRGEIIKNIIDINETRIDDLKHEEIEKQRFVNTDRQLVHCIENTTLYNPKSKSCLFCKEKAACKILLEERYPQIYHHRLSKNK